MTPAATAYAERDAILLVQTVARLARAAAWQRRPPRATVRPLIRALRAAAWAAGLHGVSTVAWLALQSSGAARYRWLETALRCAEEAERGYWIGRESVWAEVAR